MINKNQINKSRKLLNQYKAQLGPLNERELQIAVGVLLGDASLQTQNNGKTYRLKFEQSEKHKSYCFHLHDAFNSWVLSDPNKIERVNKNGNTVISWQFQTFSHHSFNYLAQLFLNEKNKKRLSLDLISPYLTPLSLAYWFMDDGGRLDYNKNGGKGIVFNTQGFSFNEVNGLCIILKNKFQLDCWVKTNKNKPVLAISGKSYEKMVQLIKPYIIPSMLYKFPSKRKS